MLRAVAVAAAGALVVVGGVTGFGRWQDARSTDCRHRSVVLAGLPLLAEQPPGVLRGDTYSGCDADRLVAYAGRQYHGEADEPAVLSFYRAAAERDAWRVTEAAPAPSDPGGAGLCGSRRLDGDTVYVSLSFPAPDVFELHVADSPDSGPARC
ncbi:hypothetical protein [Micromonospora siamensis]|uniref:Uncharacterized protein n=1 Tax=Micromonospora siamensis TaxID=299152 RepID=A0A1C5JVA0_9ACTN|nr:hypothetical protein [Micromonospora siamensis]SCG74510.1 hypothetical protein GA0074704_5051 [Micromonospora siamensis]